MRRSEINLSYQS